MLTLNLFHLIQSFLKHKVLLITPILFILFLLLSIYPWIRVHGSVYTPQRYDYKLIKLNQFHIPTFFYTNYDLFPIIFFEHVIMEHLNMNEVY